MKLFLDAEFTDFNGGLISMALVSQDLKFEFYEVLEPAAYSNHVISDWTKKNVIPVLNKDPVSLYDFKFKLFNFIVNLYNELGEKIVIVADWPEDFKHFMELLITGPGQRMPTPSLTLEYDPHLPKTATISKVPHNALFDARSLARLKSI